MNTVAFIGELRASGLLEDASLQSSVRELSRRPLTAPALARELLRRKLLTPFQAGCLLTGKGGELALGPYRLVEPAGGGCRAFRAVHVPLGREVAVKLMPCPSRHRLAKRARFERETGLAARLRHPNLVAAFDAFEKDRLYVLVTEWVPGCDLRRHVREAGPLPPATACGLALQAALGVQHAHERGLLHQRVEPENLLVAELPASPSLADLDLARMGLTCRPLKILNFGLAWLSRRPTPEADIESYLAPEQRQERPSPDQRSDLYGLGGCLYFALTGREPAAGAAPSEVCPGLPPRLNAVVRRLLAVRPADRFPSAAEVVEVLTPFCVATAPRPSSPHIKPPGQRTTLADIRGRFTAPSLSLTKKPAPPTLLPPYYRRRSVLKSIAAAAGWGLAAALALHLLQLLG